MLIVAKLKEYQVDLLDLFFIFKKWEILYALVERDWKSRFRQSVLGMWWGVIQPVVRMILFSLIFGHVARMPSDNLPYPLFNYAALIPWTFLNSGIVIGTSSVVSGAGLITKTHIHADVLPLSAVLFGFIDMTIQILLLIFLMAYYGIYPHYTLIYLPIYLFLTFLITWSVAVFCSAINVKYRDIGHVIGLITQAWMYGTPVVYASSLIPDRWKILYFLNPATPAIEGFRASLLGNPMPPTIYTIIAFIISILLLIYSNRLFRKTESNFVDYLST